MKTICTVYSIGISKTIYMKQRFAYFSKMQIRRGDMQKECFASPKATAVAEGKCSNHVSTFLS